MLNEMVSMKNMRQRIYHVIIKSPLWFKNRDFYLRSNTVYEPEQKQLTISFTSVPEYAKQKNDNVRITAVEMIWQLKYETDEQTLVTYQVYIDPKLPIKPISHATIKKSVFKTMLGLTKIVHEPIYAEIKYTESEFKLLNYDN